jgi:hypothetical protein
VFVLFPLNWSGHTFLRQIGFIQRRAFHGRRVPEGPHGETGGGETGLPAA